MIRRLISQVFKKKLPAAPKSRAKRYTGADHDLDSAALSSCALTVVSELQRAGHSAYIVGGAVRDLLLKRIPKDFDVATSATPEQAAALFRRSRIIGRRFQLVHVMCGGETIEVSTFRGPSGVNGDSPGHSDETGRILRDNVFGTHEEDALRRDFTVNALYYDPGGGELWDFAGGLKDIQQRVLRVIGDPETRYREDPVRMLRAVRLAAKLQFKIEERTREPIARMAPLLEHVPAARLFDEMLKLLLSGHALDAVYSLRAEGLHHGVLPLLDVVLEQPMGERFVTLALRNTDLRINSDRSVSPGFLFATLLWHEVLAAWQVRMAEGENELPALFEAMDQVIDTQAENLAIPRRFGATMKDIWGMQPRFPQRSGARPFRLLAHPKFRSGYDFLLLRCESGELEAELGEWWTRFIDASESERKAMLLTDSAPKRRRRRRKPKPAAAEDAL